MEGEIEGDVAADIRCRDAVLLFLSELLRHRTHAVDWLVLQVSLEANLIIQYHGRKHYWKQWRKAWMPMLPLSVLVCRTR